MLEKIEKLMIELENMEKNLIKEINQIDPNNKIFQKEIIEIMNKHPEQQDIIKFMVLMNDLQNTSKNELENLYFDTIIDLIKTKKKILTIVYDLIKEKNKPIKENKISVLKNFLTKSTPSSIGFMIISFSIMLLIIFLFIHPEKSSETFSTINKTTEKIIKVKR